MNGASWRGNKGTAAQRGYTSAWRKARASYLRDHPLCVYCEQMGIVSAATVVDHITPHNGNTDLFWDKDNWQSLCRMHHSKTKQREESLGVVIGCDEKGMPLDPNHHWNK